MKCINLLVVPPCCRPNLGSNPIWTVQSQQSLVVATTSSGAVAVQSSKGHELTGSVQLAARPLALTQPIRPTSQVALVTTQKAVGSPVTAAVVASRIPGNHYLVEVF